MKNDKSRTQTSARSLTTGIGIPKQISGSSAETVSLR